MKISNLIDRTKLKLAHLRAVISDASQTETSYSSSSDIVALEERIMLSATPMAVVADAQAVEPVDCPDNVDAPAAESQDADAQEVTSIVFVDSSVEDFQQLVDDIDQSGGTQVVLIDSQSDGIDQISEYLSRHSGIESVHIVSHGTDGEVRLGNTLLNANTLDAYAGQIAAWSSSLTSSADILFYGCDLAASEDGQHLIEALSELTGADINASDDLTGHADLGGDWDLEYVVGHIETDVIFSVTVQQDWLGTLDAVTVTTLVDEVDGDTSSIANLLQTRGADGEISLREAILAANSTFSTADEIFLGSGVHVLDRVGTATGFGDLDINSTIEITGASDGSTVIDANTLMDRVFDVSGQETTLRNLTIQGGDTSETFGGGGILASGGSTLNLDSVVLIDNTAIFGGGLRSNGTTFIVDSTFIGNHATEDGGALAITSGTATVLNSTALGNNSAGNRGGAIFISAVAGQTTHQFTNLTLSGNSALQGGGLFSNGGVTNLEHATITDNQSTGTGGSGGGINRNSGDLTVRSSIVAGNRALGSGIEIAGTIISAGNNIIGDDQGDSAGGDGYSLQTDLLDQTGLNLGALADNGGEVQTHALLAGSVGIDAVAFGPTEDARNYTRGDLRDIGAFELSATPPPAQVSFLLSTQTDVVSGNGGPGLDSYTEQEIVKVGDPNLELEPTAGTTNGTFESLVNFDNFEMNTSGDIDALHRVNISQIVDGVTLEQGDILFSTNSTITYTSNNTITTAPANIYIFRPTIAGDYSRGSFFDYLPSNNLTDVAAFTLVEQATTIGDRSVDVGDIIYSVAGDNNLRHYDASSGTSSSSIIIDGGDLGLANKTRVSAIELFDTTTDVAGVTFNAGELLISLDRADTIGAVSANGSDLLRVVTTSTGDWNNVGQRGSNIRRS